MQTLEGKAVDGQFHQITKISHDDKGNESKMSALPNSLRCVEFNYPTRIWTTSAASCHGL